MGMTRFDTPGIHEYKAVSTPTRTVAVETTPISRVVRTPTQQTTTKEILKVYKQGDYSVKKDITDELGLPAPSPGENVDVGIPEIIGTSLEQAPIVAQMNLAVDFWELVLGTPEQKMDVVETILPMDETGHEIFEEKKQEILDSPDNTWFKEPMATIPGVAPFKVPEIKLPDLSGVGKWLLIGGLILGAILIIPALIKGGATIKASEKVTNKVL